MVDFMTLASVGELVKSDVHEMVLFPKWSMYMEQERCDKNICSNIMKWI